MIKIGLSPYFVKYGYARLAANHDRYIVAEREAQTARRGVWDQIAGNGREVNNYAALTTWWTLRAKVIDEYRQHLATNPADPALNTRLDYEDLLRAAQQNRELSVFTELRNVRKASTHAVIDIGSRKRRFCVFIPDAYASPSRARVLNLLNLRYIAGDLAHPRRGLRVSPRPARYVQGDTTDPCRERGTDLRFPSLIRGVRDGLRFGDADAGRPRRLLRISRRS